ncbi:MAG: IgGFc-binding protein [Deltaproteobacteria bacterium]|nr:IgGFc-binding protein [Deltaproteobacteria bacterium]
MSKTRASACVLSALLAAAAVACVVDTDVIATDYGPGEAGHDAAIDAAQDVDADKMVIIEGGLGDVPTKECRPCSADGKQVLSCDGTLKKDCPTGQRCGLPGECMAPCDAARANKSTVGCDYHPVAMAAFQQGFGGCFVAFVANTWEAPVHIQASFGGAPIDLSQYAKVPSGKGQNITYAPYDTAAGLLPDQVAILFLANDPVPHGTWYAAKPCPVPAAIGLDAQVHMSMSVNTGRGTAFHVSTDQPIVAYQMLPYGGGRAQTTGATLLLPTSAWDTNYVAVMGYRSGDSMGLPIPPTLALVARDDTTVTILPKEPIKDGILVTGGPANVPIEFSMKAGETIELIQNEDLTGSPIAADKPIGVFAGHMGLRVPYQAESDDHAEQQIPPVKALGSEYPSVSFRDRIDGVAENRLWRIVGVVDGTLLTFDPPIPTAPPQVSLGEVAEFNTDEPFVVTSQDKDHPFMVFTYMSGWSTIGQGSQTQGYGDPDFVRMVPGAQYLDHYVFFTDPTFPETNLVVVRKKGEAGFADVNLDCAGMLQGWKAIGTSGSYEYTRIDLSRHNFEAQGACDNGRHEMSSKEPFGLWVWGWGSPETQPGQSQPCEVLQPDSTCKVSYGYPAGQNVVPINEVVVLPTPK